MIPEYDLYIVLERYTCFMSARYKFSGFALTPSLLNNSDITRYGLYYKLLISNVIFTRKFTGEVYVIVPKK